MLMELTGDTGPGSKTYVETGTITYVRDNGDSRVLESQGGRSYRVQEPLAAFLEQGFVAASGPSGDAYAVNTATVGAVQPMDDGVEVRFANPGNSRSVKVVEYQGIVRR
ncbi:MAG: hypothetical protein Q7U75_18065 [Desulfobacterales bacterium]|nr:hypothetical protein [Desulfobacterales bacterium]